jgi:hypothetical protein
MPLNKFVPLSPDPYITSDPEMTLAKFGHLNTIVDYLNAYVAVDSLQLAGSGPITSTARYISDSTGVNSAISISTIGVGIGTNTLLGILHLKSTAATTRMVMDGDAGQSKIITYRTAGLQRFGLYVNNTAESGANAGSDFAVRAYSDAGTLLSTALFIKRSTGNVGIGTDAPTKKLEVSGTARINDEFSITNSGLNARFIQVRRASGWLCFGNTAGSESIAMNGSNLLIGTTPDTQTSTRLQITGSGSTSATTSLLVQNSNGTESFKVTDDRSVTISGGTTTISSSKTFINGISTTTSGFGDTGYGMAIDGGIRFGVEALQGYKFGYWYGLSVASNWNNGSTSTIIVGQGAVTPNINNITFTSVDIIPTFNVNFIGRVGNIIRGIYYNPTITAFINGVRNQLRAFESSVGGVFINTTNVEGSAILQADSTTQGFLPPRMTTAQKNLIATPATGLQVHDTDLNRPCFYNGTSWVTL